MTQQVSLGDLVGTDLEEDFLQFDLTDIQQVLENLREIEAIDLSHAEQLQQQALRGADILTGYLGKIVKTVGYLESKVNSTKNKASLEYHPAEGKATMEMRKWAADVSPEVEIVQNKLAVAKGSKLVLERKYEILVKAHHHFKDIAQGLRKSILGYSSNTPTTEPVPHGYE